MAVTVEDLAKRVGARNPADVATALATAQELLTAALEGAFREMPEATRDECVLSIGFAVHDRTKSSDGYKQGTVMMDGQTPMRAPRDPLASVRSILANYVAGIA